MYCDIGGGGIACFAYDIGEIEEAEKNEVILGCSGGISGDGKLLRIFAAATCTEKKINLPQPQQSIITIDI